MNKKNIINWTLLLILSVIWGSSFILMKKGLIGFNYLEVAFFRLIIAFLVLSPFLIQSLKKIRKQHIVPIIIVSIIGTVVPAVLFALAQTNLDSSTTGMLNSLTPIFTLIMGIYFFDKKWNTKNIIGVFIGCVGSYILLLPSSANFIETKYSILLIFATMCYAFSINTIKENLAGLSALNIAVSSSFLSFLIPLIFIVNNGLFQTIYKIENNIESFYYLIILGAICTSIAIILFNFLIKKSSALFSSSTTYLIPVFAIIWGIIDNETIEKHEIFGILVILTGVFIMNYQQLE